MPGSPLRRFIFLKKACIKWNVITDIPQFFLILKPVHQNSYLNMATFYCHTCVSQPSTNISVRELSLQDSST
jgi:hypothetical protein